MTPQIWGFASGTRTRDTEFSSGGSLTVSNHPLLAITCELRPIEIGVTNRIRTGTDAVTGRNAADYIMTTDKMALSRGFAPRTSAFAERRAELITP